MPTDGTATPAALAEGWPYEPRSTKDRDSGHAQPEDKLMTCTLTDGEREARAGSLRSDFVPRIVDLEEIQDGCIFWFQRSEQDLTSVMDFVQVESECCSFLDFGIGLSAGGDRISLRISGPHGPGSFPKRAREALRAQQSR